MTTPPAKPMAEHSRQPGFTLVEILVVIAIIGVLSVIAAISIQNYRTQSRLSKAQHDIDAIRSAINVMGNDTGEWPGHQPMDYFCPSGDCGFPNEVWDLNLPAAGVTQNDGAAAFTGWNGPYMPSVPADPWGNSYFFDTDYDINPDPAAGATRWAAVIGSFGPDAKDVSSGDLQTFHYNKYDTGTTGEDNIIVVAAQ